MGSHHCDAAIEGERANSSIAHIDTCIRESERRNYRESVGSNVKLYDCAIVLGPLIGYFRAKIISYNNLACECVARASQYWNFIGDNLGYSNCKKFKETKFY